MKVQKVFNRKVVKFSCKDEKIFEENKFIYILNKFMNGDYIKNSKVLEMVGDSNSTCNLHFVNPLEMTELYELKKWIHSKIMEASSQFVEFEPFEINFFRIWVNRMFKNSHTLIHNHINSNKLDAVGIFYVNIDDNSDGDLIFIKDGNFLSDISEYTIEDIFYSNVKTGDFIIHDPNIQHTVSTYTGDNPRICIILEFEYMKNKSYKFI